MSTSASGSSLSSPNSSEGLFDVISHINVIDHGLAWAKLLNLSVLHFPHLKSGDNKPACLVVRTECMNICKASRTVSGMKRHSSLC